MASSCAQQSAFFPKADAAVLSCRLAPPPTYPKTVGPIYDRENAETPVQPWSSDAQKTNYPPPKEAFAPALIPEKHLKFSDRYLRASLAKNERLRLSMLWYYTCDIFEETEFLAGLQEKVCIAHETTGWEFAIIGILDLNFYTRLATIGVPLGILPRGETLCAHTVTQPPGNVFLLPNMLEDWRFEDSPYVESGGLRAYAGAPLRLQIESGETVCFGSLCVASPTPQDPLTKAQQTTLARLADWVVGDIIQLTRARRQRARRRMVELLAIAREEMENATSEETVIRLLQATYPTADITLQTSKAGYVEVEGRGPVLLSILREGLWEDVDYIDDFIAKSNHRQFPTDRVVRLIAAQCESVSGQASLVVASKNFRLVFDDVDAWFVQTCADMISQMWHKRLLAEVMLAKEKFLRGFSHQLRTPVHGILGSVELLAEELRSWSVAQTAPQSAAALTPKSSGETSDYLNTIKRAGRDLISIINSMITLNRWSDVATTNRQYAMHTTYELEAILADETIQTISGDTRYNACIIVNHKLPPDNCSLRIDLNLMRDSLLPLIINAIQNTPEGIVAIEVSAHPDTKELIVDVTDSGRGIPCKDHQRIFELYEQVDDYSTGAGLGLTLSSKFAALHDGSVELVSSEIGRGSHFKAAFKGVEVEFSDTSSLADPLVPKPASLPHRFHTLSSSPKAWSLCDHFAKFLTCHGFTSSDMIEDALVIFDFVTVPEEHLATVSRLSHNQVGICLIPYPEGQVPVYEHMKNVIYAYGPFLTSTMSLALKHADDLYSQIRANQADSCPITNGPKTIQQLHAPNGEVSVPHENGASNALDTSRGAADSSGAAQASDTGDSASTVGQVHVATTDSRLIESKDVKDGPRSQIDQMLVDISHLQTAQLPLRIPSPEEGLENSSLNGSATAVPETLQRPLIELQNSQSESMFPDLAVVSHPTALLVDDNIVNLKVMQMYCRKRNLPFICAKDGLQAVAAFQEHQESAAVDRSKSPIQLVLMDLQMPGCDGIEATRQIRQLEMEKQWASSVLFIVTGQDSPADRKAAADAGSQEYYVKPISIKRLDSGLKQYFPSFEVSKPPGE